MGSGDPGLSRLGRLLAEEEGELLRGRPRDPEARERFIAAALALEAARGARRGLVTPARGAAAIAAIAAGVALFVFLARRPLQFVVGADATADAGVAGAWIATPPDQATPLRFTDGTTFQIQPASKVRVAAVGPAGGRIVLENGGVRASVVHRFDTRWLVDSGPFEVRVTGTRFEVRWDLAAEELVVRLEEGSVAVSGPSLGEGLAVRAGQTLRVQRRESHFELRSDESPTIPLPPPVASPVLGSSDPEAPRAPGAPPASPPRAAAPVRAPRQSWRELSAAGRFKEALEAVDREGFARVCAEGSAVDLRDLADAARLSGDSARAVTVLTTLRRRFPGDDQAAEAAFLLGVIAFGEQGGHAESAQWFTTYLSERPRGRLAREAAGRLIEVHDKSGDRTGAREAARRYLRDFPGGPHAEMAKAILGE